MPPSGAASPHPFVLVLPFRPISQAAGGRRAYQERLRTEAAAALLGRSQLSGSLYARITYLHRAPSTQDVDNIVKRILDALKGLAFADDGAIRQCLAERIWLTEGFTISERNRPSTGYARLAALLYDNDVHHITYIEIGQAREQLISFGPVGEEVQ